MFPSIQWGTVPGREGLVCIHDEGAAGHGYPRSDYGQPQHGGHSWGKNQTHCCSSAEDMVGVLPPWQEDLQEDVHHAAWDRSVLFANVS